MTSAGGLANTRVRRAELIGALSLATDLGLGQPMDHGLRRCVLAVRLAEGLGISGQLLADVYHVALLHSIGCSSNAWIESAWVGDELAFRSAVSTVDLGQPKEFLPVASRRVGSHKGPLGRAVTLARMPLGMPRELNAGIAGNCEVAQRLAERLGFGAGVRAALGHIFERWNGSGFPQHLRGETIALPARVVLVAGEVEVFLRLHGPEAAVAIVRRRAGSAYDPAIAERVLTRPAHFFEALEEAASWEAVLALEPGPRPVLGAEELDTALETMADFADLKSTFTLGHSRGVARLVEAAARACCLPAADAHFLWRAGLVHDLGRVGVPNSVWDKPGPLHEAERERVRLHAYLTERMLTRPPALAALGAVATQHHERLDGSGYHRGLAAAGLPFGSRLLAAADCYQAMAEPRPHRPALNPTAAEAELRGEVKQGRVDGQAVNAVLEAAGHRVRRQREWPAGLSAREVEVLGYVARGLPSRAIGRRLHLTKKTVDHHVQHIYDKLGVSTRAAATLFAVQHDLLAPLEATAQAPSD